MAHTQGAREGEAVNIVYALIASLDERLRRVCRRDFDFNAKNH